MTTNNPQSAAPGWYPDPWGQAQLRYFDGAQWTTHLHGERADAAGVPTTSAPAPSGAAEPAASHAAPTDTSAAASAEADPPPRRRRTGLIVGLSIGATAIVAVIAVVVALLVVPQFSSPKLYTDISAQYDYTDDQLDLPRDHEFEFDADYDLEAVNAAADPEGAASDSGAASPAFQVYYDRALSMEAEYFTYQPDPGERVSITGDELGTAFGDGDARIMDAAEAVTSWGLHDEYFLVQRVDRSGAQLAKPIVTRFTVTSSLQPPLVTFQDPAGDGSLQLSWEPVDGATEYVIVSSYRDGQGTRLYRYAGTTSETTWSSSSDEDADENWRFRQNTELQLFKGDSADRITAGQGVPDEEAPSQYDLGVIATDGDHFSPYISHDLATSAASLPLEGAFYANRNLKKWGPTGFIEGMENVQRRFAFTSIDGLTRTTVATINAEGVRDLGDRWGLPLVGQGTSLGEWVPVTKSSVPDVTTAVAQFNAEAQAAAPPTGMSKFEIAPASISEAPQPVSETPQSPYPVYGSTELTRYLGAHLIAGTTWIDVSAFDGPGTPDPLDALFEADLQNPYARPIRGASASRDGSSVLVSYRESSTLGEAGQAELLATVDRVVAETVNDAMTDADKVAALNDWLAAHAEYDDEAFASKNAAAGDPGTYQYAWEPTGVLLNQRGVCQSYAEAFMALANAAGVQTVVVTGDVVDGGRHAWNKVVIDGTWLAVDTTWNDDPSYPNEYLMIPDSGFTGSATRTEDAYWAIDGTLAAYATP